MQGKIIRPENFGWLEYKLDSNSMAYLWKIIEDAKVDNKLNLHKDINVSYRSKNIKC